MEYCWCTSLEVPQVKSKIAPMQRKTKVEAGDYRLVSGRFKKQGNLHGRLVLGSCKTSGTLHPPARILKAYIEVLTGSSRVFSPDGLNTTLFYQGCVLEMAPSARRGQRYIPRMEGGCWLQTSDCANPPHRSTGGHVLSMTSPILQYMF